MVATLCATLIVGRVISSALHQSLELRSIELARSIDDGAMVTGNRGYLQNLVAGHSAYGTTATVVVARGEPAVIVAASNPKLIGNSLAALPDAALRDAMTTALRTGSFSSCTGIGFGRTAAVLPLVPETRQIEAADPGQSFTWLIPAWHSQHLIPSASGLDLVLAPIGAQPHALLVESARESYGGVIAVEMSPGFALRVANATVAFIALLFGLSAAAMLGSTWATFRRHVAQPLGSLRMMVERQRSGDRAVRAGPTGVGDFDVLAGEWNALLDEQTRAEEKQRVLAELMEHVPVGIEIIDRDDRIEHVNSGFLALTGTTSEAVIGRPASEVGAFSRLPPEAADQARQKLVQGEIWRGELRLTGPIGPDKVIDLMLCPVLNAGGALERVVALWHDISERNENEQKLIAARLTAEAADRAKSEFIALMSHELRTPLNSVIGFAGIIARDQVGLGGQQSYREYGQIIETSAMKLLSIINTIIELNRLDKGTSAIEAEPFAPGLTAARVIASHDGELEASGIAITLIDRSRNAALLADPRAFRRILEHLLSNAIRFNRRKAPRIKVRIMVDREGRLSVAVRDTGIGIPPEALARVSEAFFQLRSGVARSHDGVGLGLTLARALAEAHGATLTIDSTLGIGTTVTVTFPSSRTIRARRRRGKPSATVAA
ncbi:MAG: PAS domain-containing sensor histidine kinase [Aestuariivirgaceae bacterium]